MSGSDEQPAEDPNDSLSGDAEPISNGLRALIGRNLKAARIALGLRQQEFAVRAGFGQDYISRVEAGQVNLTIDTLRRLAAALGQDARFLLDEPSDTSGERDTEPPG